jgi:hypothetical protein
MISCVSFRHVLVQLHRRGKLHGVITQNTDNLHRLSGVPPSILVEIHGNNNLMECVGCNQRYFFDECVLSKARHAACTTSEIRLRRSRHLLTCDPNHPLIDLDPLDPLAAAELNGSDHFNTKYTGHFCVKSHCRQPLVDVIIEFDQVSHRTYDARTFFDTDLSADRIMYASVLSSCTSEQALYDEDWERCRQMGKEVR